MMNILKEKNRWGEWSEITLKLLITWGFFYFILSVIKRPQKVLDRNRYSQTPKQNAFPTAYRNEELETHVCRCGGVCVVGLGSQKTSNQPSTALTYFPLGSS